MEGRKETRPRRTPEEIRAEIQRTREQLASAAAALHEEVAMRMDWREWVRRRPGLFIAAAFVAGFWIGSRPERRRF